jgi:hypothetical protein
MADAPAENELAATLEMFDRVAVNLDNLQQVWEEMTEYTDSSAIVINIDRIPFIGPPAVRAGGWWWSAG